MILLYVATALFMATPIVAANEGAFEINQACVAGGCFPGDDPGWPVTLVESGRYFLSSNLAVPDENTGGIVAQTGNVEIDLAGFTITGPVTCSGSPAVCNSSGTGVGLSLGLFENSRVGNGRITGMGQTGVFTGPNNRVYSVTADQNGNSGIVARAGTVVVDSFAYFNGRLGIEVGAGGQLRNCVAANNTQIGFATGGDPSTGGAIIVGGSTYENGEQGIFDWGNSLIKENLIRYNGTIGIDNENGGSLIEDNVIVGNIGGGVNLRGATAFDPAGLPTTLSGNQILLNNGGNMQPQITGPGTLIETSTNVCGTDTTCP